VQINVKEELEYLNAYLDKVDKGKLSCPQYLY
jgi:hypothetical protein